MNSSSHVISNVFNDKNINKDERYMFLMFISMVKDIKEEITISINDLMESFQTKGKKKVLSILKSLKEKGYIEIIKIIGKTNKYRIIKSYVCDYIKKDYCSKEEHYNNENYYNAQPYDDNNSSSNLDTGVELTSGYLDNSSEITGSNNDTGIKIDSGYIDTSIDVEPGNMKVYSCRENAENKQLNEDIIYPSNEKNRYNYNLNNNNKNNIYINNNKLYINIFNTWNETNINNEKILYPSVKSAIDYAINNYGEDEVIAAIKNYSEVYYIDFYYDFGWNLISFLRKPNAIKRFLNSGDMWINYSRRVENEKQKDELEINIEDYID